MTTIEETVGRVTGIVEGLFSDLGDLVACAERVLDGPRPVTDDLKLLDPLAQAALGRADGLIVGAGFVAAAGVLDDSEYWLQWWSDYDTPRTWVPRQLQVEIDPHSESFNDYTTLPWFKSPRADGRRHVTGPYVDFLCTDEYTLTLTVPIFAGSRFSGVVGADVYARVMESVIAPVLADLEGPSALLNAVGRVVTASHCAYATGDMVRDRAVVQGLADLAVSTRPGASTEVHGGMLSACADLGLAVIAGPVLGS